MLAKKKEVIKASAVINMSCTNMNLIQRKSFNVLLANAFDDLLKKDIFIIPLRVLAETIDYTSNDQKYLRESIEDITEQRIRLNVFDKINNIKINGVSVLLSSAYFAGANEEEDSKSYLFYAFDPILKRFLANPKMYAKISLLTQNKFTSIHSLSMFENGIDYLDIKKGKGTIPFMSLEEFKGLVGISENEYTDFKILNRDVIKKIIREVDKKGNLIITPKTKKTGRKISHIGFDIEAKTNFYDSLKRDKEGIIEQVSELSDDRKLLDLLSNKLKVNKVIATRFIKECDNGEIAKLIADTKERHKGLSGTDINFGGYLAGAIKNYLTSREQLLNEKRKKEELLKDKLQREQEEEARAEEESKKRAKEMRESKSRRDETFAYVFNSLNESDRKSIFEKYSLNLKTKITKYNLEKKQNLAKNCQTLLNSFEEKKLFNDKVRDDFYTFLIINKIFEYSADENKVKVNI